MKIEGLKEAADRLRDLDRKVQRTIVRKGLRLGAKVVLGQAKADAPRRTGLLASNVKIRAGGTRNGTTRLTVGIGSKDFKGPSWYGAAVLFGHRVGNRRLGDARKLVPANNFLERAFDETAERAVDVTTESWMDQIEAAAGGAT